VADNKSNRKDKDTGTPGGSRPLQRRLYLTDCWNASKISIVGEGQCLWLLELLPVCRQTAPYSPEFEPDIVLTELQPPHRSLRRGRDFAHPLVIADGGSVPLHWMAA